MITPEQIAANKEQILMMLSVIKRSGMDSLIAYLLESDFFMAPASTKYHGAYEGGLAEHSLHVWHLLMEKNNYYRLGLSTEVTTVTALLHDVCKIGFYTKEMKSVLKGKKKILRNKKVDGQWIEVEEEVNDWQQEEVITIKDQFPMGHGEKSAIMLLRFIQLTDLEIAMIRWHMGGYVSKENYAALHNAVDMYPAIIALHSADLEASHLLKIGGRE